MKTGLMLFPLLLLAVAGCTRGPSDCARSVAQFRATLRTDPSLAAVPDDAIDLARAHRTETSTACVLANGYADDAEKARRDPPPPVTPIVLASPTPALIEVGTPRVHFEITPPPFVATPPVTPADRVRHTVAEPTPAPSPEATVATPTPAPVVQPTPNARAACRRDCASVWNPLARTACEQRCDGATPLPGATSEPIIIH